MQVYSITLNDLSETNQKFLIGQGYTKDTKLTIILDDVPVKTNEYLIKPTVKTKTTTKTSNKATSKSVVKPKATSKVKTNYEDKLKESFRNIFTIDMKVNPNWSPVILEEFNRLKEEYYKNTK